MAKRSNPIRRYLEHDRTKCPHDRKEMADNLREIRADFGPERRREANHFCRAVLGNFYTGLATRSPCYPGR